VTTASGVKFGKTESGAVWLDTARTSPFQFYQFWLNSADNDARKWIKIFTFLPENEIEELIAEHEKNASERILQKTLAKEITSFVHGKEGLQQALETTEKLFADKNAPAENLTEDDLESMEGVVRMNYPSSKLNTGVDVVSFLAETNIFPSKGEARKMIQNGGVSINRKKVSGLEFAVSGELLLHEKYILVQKGKKNYYLVKVIGE
jgi:tyrosyl-tRNA synthetase